MTFDKVLLLLYTNGMTKGFTYDFENPSYRGVRKVLRMDSTRIYTNRLGSPHNTDWVGPHSFPQYNNVTKVTLDRSIRGVKLAFMLRSRLS